MKTILGLKKEMQELQTKYNSLKLDYESKIIKLDQLKKECQYHLYFIKCIDRVNGALHGTTDLNQMMIDVLDVVLDIFNCDRVSLVYPCDPDSPTWTVPMERFKPEYPGVASLGAEMLMTPEVAKAHRDSLQAKHPLVFGLETDIPMSQDILKFGDKSGLGMAIRPKTGKPWGFALTQCSHIRKWTPEEKDLFEEIGKRLSDVLTTLLLYTNVQESEKRYKMIFENSPIPIWEEDFSAIKSFFNDLKKQGISDVESYFDQHPESVQHCARSTRIVDVNNAAVQMHGVTNKEALKKGLLNFFSTDSLKAFQKELVTLWNGGTEFSIDSIVLKKDGAPRDVTVYFSVCPGFESSFSKVLVSIVDITERVQSKKDLKKLNNILKTTIDAAPTAIVGLDLDGKVQNIWNKAAEKMLGWNAQEVMGKFLPSVSKENKKEFENFRQKIRKGLRLDGIEVKRQKRDGSPIEYSIYASPMFNDDGEISGNMAVLVDITERKKQEKKLIETTQRLNETQRIAKLGGWELVHDTNELIWSDEIYRIFEINPDEFSATYEAFLDTIHPEDREMVNQVYLNSLKTKKSYCIEHRLQFPDGRIKYVNEQCETLYEGDKPVRSVGTVQDITRQKKSEEKVIQLASIVESSNDAIIGKTTDGIITSWNKGAENIYGYNESEMIGKPLSLIVPAELNEEFNKIQERIKAGESIKNFETVRLRKDGQQLNVSLTSSPLFDSSGKVVGASTIGRDITKQKNIEDSLKASEERYRLIAENTADMITVRDLNLNTIYVSPSVQKLRGYTVKESMSQHLDQILTPKSVQIVKESLAEQLKLEENKESDPSRSILFELDQIHKNGSIIKVEVSVSFIRDGNLKPVSILVITRDITKRKQAEEKAKVLSHAVEQNPIMILITDIEGKIEYVNPKFEEITGYSQTEVIGQKPKIIRSNNMPAEIYKDMWDTIKANKVWQGELINNKKNGEPYWANLSISPITDDEGSIIHYVGIQEDITRRKKTEEELIFAKEHAEESDRLKSAFLTSLSHEIRTPMNGILGFAELLKSLDLKGDQQNEYIKMIDKAGNRMLNIIEDIVSISKIESGLMAVNKKEVNVNEHIQQVYTLLKPNAEQKGLKLSFKNCLITSESNIKTDSPKLYSIITNLVKNAIKYTDRGTVDFGYVKRNNYLEFFVKDTGIGIPKYRQQAIFERFIRADIKDKQVREGAGLGLSISKAYIELLGGKIWVESKPEVGSTFYFTLPYNRGIYEKEDGIKDLVSSSKYSKMKNLKILIVEDDKTSEIMLSIFIKDLCSKVLIARSGKEAVEICRNNPDLDFVLMDIMLPELNGYKATRQIREFNKDVVIIAQIAYARVGDREKYLDAGCNDYIKKPFSKENIQTLLRKHLQT